MNAQVLTLRPLIEQRVENKSAYRISVLRNSLAFALEYVFILKTGREYRLVVKNFIEILIDRSFRTHREALKTFKDRFGPRKSNQVKISPLWSKFFDPLEEDMMTRYLFLVNHRQPE